jgi:predicted Fe-Mo cluster-binding NifX family protein
LKFIFSTKDNNGELSVLDDRFGRATGFVLYDSTTDKWSWIDNAVNTNAPAGAGVQAAQTVANSGSDIYIGAQLGPKAFEVLSKCDIELLVGAVGRTVSENYSMYEAGELARVSG